MKNLFKALADFQQEVPTIHKDTQGYSYTYTDLPEIIRIITPLLKKHSLGFTQPIMGSQLKTIIFHTESGEFLEATADIPDETMKGMNKFQTLGSGITYLRRYAISSMLGLVTEKDMDASSIEDNLSRTLDLDDLNALFGKLTVDQKKKFQKLFDKRKTDFSPTPEKNQPQKPTIQTDALKKEIDTFSNVDEFSNCRKKYALTADQLSILTDKFTELFPNYTKTA